MGSTLAGTDQGFLYYCAYNITGYPFGTQLGTQLTSSDWTLLRRGQPFAANLLSNPVQAIIRAKLIDESSLGGRGVPLLWPSLEPKELEVVPSLLEEPVVTTVIQGRTQTCRVSEAAMLYRVFSQRDSELQFQAGYRQTVVLRINSSEEGTVTGIGSEDIKPAGNPRSGPWTALPELFRLQFEQALNEQNPE